MRNVKKFLALVLAMLMVVSAAATVSAFEDVADDHAFAAAINDLTVKEIVNGYDGETFGPDDAVTRQQMALMMARAITGNVGDDAVWAQGGLVGFEDVTEYQYAIATVVKAGIVDGFLDNTFRPEEGITFVQALKMAVAALGYDNGNLEWWQGYYNVALDLGLTENLNYITDADKALNRGEVAQLIYNMLYIDLADGSDCFASQNFGLATADNITTFVITATDKQTAAAGMDVTEGGFVGVQQLVNGVPEGDVYYIENEAFGFEENEDEDAFLSAYGFVNWDNGDFDQIIPVGESWKVYNTEITEASTKFAYDGKNYYLVDELTGTAIKNEVVIYNATDYGYTATNKQLFLNKNGQVLDGEGDPILEAVYAVNGDLVSYYVLRSAVAPDKSTVTKGDYLTIAEATEKYGTGVGEVTVPFTTMEVAELKGAYELTVYDDNMDGKMDRAYYNPVYVSAHESNLNSSVLRYGPMKTAAKKNTTFVDVEGETVALADGEVYKYTYNKQLNVVTVLDTYEVQTGILSRINTRDDDDDAGNQGANYYAVKLTIDGEVYTMGNLKREVMGIDGFVIANHDPNVTAIANLSGKDNEGNSFAGVIGSGYSTIGYTYENDSFNKLHAGDTVRFLAVDGTIVLIEAYDIEEAFDLVVVDDIVDYDLEAVYMDLWIDGELVEDVAVSRIYDGKKYVNLADLNVFKLYDLVGKLATNVKGNIYRAVPVADGSYQISEVFTKPTKRVIENVADEDEDPQYKILADEFKLAYLASDTTIVFEDGVADKKSSGAAVSDGNVLRTDDDTLFYFLRYKGEEIISIYTYVGEPEDGAVINMAGDNAVYANKIGYANGNDGSSDDEPINGIKGVADVVVVYYANANDIKGFGVTSVGEKVVYIADWDDTDNEDHDEKVLERDFDLGSEFELSRAYADTYLYYYSGNYGIDMHTGERVTTIYSEDKLERGEFYVLSNENVVIGTAEDEGYEVVTSALIKEDFVEGKYWTGTILDREDEVVTLKMVNATAEITSSNVKTDSLTLLDAKEEKNVSYLVDYEDGIFVGIVSVIEEEEEEEEDGDLPNAYYMWTGAAFMGTLDMDTKSSTEISGNFLFENENIETIDYSHRIDLDDDNLLDVGDADIVVTSIKVGTSSDDDSVVAAPADGYDIDVTMNGTDGIAFVLEAGQKTQDDSAASFSLTSGTKYYVKITFTAGGTTFTVRGSFTA